MRMLNDNVNTELLSSLWETMNLAHLRKKPDTMVLQDKTVKKFVRATFLIIKISLIYYKRM